MKRILIFTGKGGVGKSSVAAAHAIHSAKEGVKTLLVSTDMAHNLNDIFHCGQSRRPVSAADNLYILEIDPAYIMDNDYENMQSAISKLFISTSIPEDALAQINTFPGIEELFSLLKIMDIYENEDYERIIIDCAPTGETLSLLKFPELLSWYMEKFFPVEKVALRILAPVSKKLFKVELPDQKAMTDIERIYVKMRKLQELLKNKTTTSIRLVSLPEKMVVEETKRNYMYLNLYGFLVDGLYINRILPADLKNSFFEGWLTIQSRYIAELTETFADIPIYKIPWFDADLNGHEGIARMEKEIFCYEDVFRIKSDRQTEQYEKTENGYCLSIYVPCSSKEDLKIHEAPMDLIIKVDNFKRSIPKPNVLRTYGIVSAKLNDHILYLMFQEKGS